IVAQQRQTIGVQTIFAILETCASSTLEFVSRCMKGRKAGSKNIEIRPPCAGAALKADTCGAPVYVRFGSLADMCSAKRHVRFTPNSDRESGLRQTVMSALPPIANICSALAHVR